MAALGFGAFVVHLADIQVSVGRTDFYNRHVWVTPFAFLSLFAGIGMVLVAVIVVVVGFRRPKSG
jgi:hypothetical protein